MDRAGTVIVALSRVERLLLRIGRKQQELDALQAEMDQRIAAVRAEYGERLQGRAETITALERELNEVCEAERGTLLDGDARSIETLFGRVGWRKGRDSIKLRDEVSEDEVAGKLARRGYDALVKVKRTVSRSAVLAALNAGRITERVLSAVGLLLEPGEDRWYYEVNASAVQQYQAGDDDNRGA